MQKLLPSYSISEYIEDDVSSIEVFSQTLYDVIKEAIANNAIQALSDSLRSINVRQERVSNILNIQDINNSKCFQFGYITALSTLGEDLAQSDVEDSRMLELINSYPLLLPMLEIIEKYDTISGVKLKEETGQKSSNISNFMRRIEPYKLIDTKRVGTINYYSLTSKGRRLLSQYHQRKPESVHKSTVPEQLVLTILDEVATEIRKDKPSSVPILKKVAYTIPDFNEKKLLKYKIETVFLSREAYMRKLAGTPSLISCDYPDDEKFENWDDHYIMDRDDHFWQISDLSYI